MLVLDFLEANPGAFVIVCVALGLVVGSFLNVVAHRLPRMLEREWTTECQEILGQSPAEPETPEPYNLVVPRSRCPRCAHGITALENIPLLSYALLRGRCSACGWSIPWRYPAIELLSGLAAGVVAAHFGFGMQALGAMLLSWALIAASAIDLDTQLLPDVITLPFLWLGLAFNLGGVFTSSTSSLIGAMAGYGLLWGVYHGFRLLTGKEGMGHGDFKLLAMLGAWLGWQAIPLTIFLSSLVGAAVGLSLMALRGHDRNVPIPFGPYIAMAGWIAMLWGQDITGAYMSFSGLDR